MKWITKKDIKHEMYSKIPTATIMGKNCGYTVRLNVSAMNHFELEDDMFITVGIDDENLIVKFIKDKNDGLHIIREPSGLSISSKAVWDNLNEMKWPTPFRLPIEFDTENRQWVGNREDAIQYNIRHKKRRKDEIAEEYT